jgi:hypothetical protein
MMLDEQRLTSVLHELADREQFSPPPTQRVLDRVRPRATAARRRVGWSLAGTGVLAAAAAAALVLGAGTAPVPTPDRAPTGQEILLAAAEGAERAPATPKRYWVVKTTLVVRYLVNAGYHVTDRQVVQEWKAQLPRDLSWTGSLNLGAKPSTPDDEAAWRADGSPTEWRMGPVRLSTASESARVVEHPTGGGDYFGESEVSLAEIRSLPADPEALKRWGERRINRQSIMPTDTDVHFATAITLLTSAPAAPAVRAAAFRLLASLPGVRNEGKVRDALGRTGTRIVVAYGDRQHEAIVDEAAGQILASKGNREPRNDCAGSDQQDRCDGKVTGVPDSYFEVEYSDGPPRPPTTR